MSLRLAAAGIARGTCICAAPVSLRVVWTARLCADEHSEALYVVSRHVGTSPIRVASAHSPPCGRNSWCSRGQVPCSVVAAPKPPTARSSVVCASTTAFCHQPAAHLCFSRRCVPRRSRVAGCAAGCARHGAWPAAAPRGRPGSHNATRGAPAPEAPRPSAQSLSTFSAQSGFATP